MKFDISYYDDQGNRNPDGLNYRGVCDIEVSSGIIKSAFAKFAAAWQTAPGGTTFRFVARNMWEAPLGESGVRKYGVNDDYWGPLPVNTRSVTVEGRRDNPHVEISASLLPLAA